MAPGVNVFTPSRKALSQPCRAQSCVGDWQLPLKLQNSLEALDPPGYSLEGKMPPSQGAPPSAGQPCPGTAQRADTEGRRRKTRKSRGCEQDLAGTGLRGAG